MNLLFLLGAASLLGAGAGAAFAPPRLDRRATANPNIVFNFTGNAFTAQCISSQWTVFFGLTVKITIGGVSGLAPMGETGLPTVHMAFFLNGANATLTVPSTYNVAGSTASGNVWTFTLQDDQPNIGGQANLGACASGATTPTVTAYFWSTSNIVGEGIASKNVPALSGIPTIVNGLAASNVAKAATTTTTTATPTPTPTPASTKKTTATPTPTPSPSAAAASSSSSTLDGNCVLTYPNTKDAILSAAGLATPWTVTAGCDQTADTPSFIQGTIFDPNTGKLTVYNPLVINAGTQPAITPTAPTLPSGAIVVLHFGTNGCSTTLADASGGAMLKAANCVNGGGADNSIFGQFAYCNAVAFFASVNANLGKLNPAIPALGTDKTGLTCTTTRSFGLVDQDPSDNVVTAYLLTSDNLMAQNTTANQAALTKAGKTFNIITNGSDNRLNLIINGVVGCTSYMAPDLANNNVLAGSLALNEIMAANRQKAPVAKIPITDPMVVMADGNVDTTGAKLAAYRKGVNENFANAANLGNGTAFCSHLGTISPTYMAAWANAGLTTKAPSPDAGTGTNLATFLGARFQAAWGLLGCDVLLGIASPVTCFDANGNAAGDNPAAKCTITTTVTIQSVNDPSGDDQPDSTTSGAAVLQTSLVATASATLLSVLLC